MKVLLLGFGKIAYMPYMNFYVDVLQNINNIEIELIYWDRDGKPDVDIPSQISKAYKFEAHIEEQLPFKNKMRYFFQYRSFALKILRDNTYDRIVVLHTTPGLTLLDYLIRKYRNRYILDFRDISYEYISVYKWLVGKLVNASAITYVSSNAFRNFLPSLPNIYTIHNYLEDSLKHRMLRKAYSRNRDILRISYWGLVRQFYVNKRVIDAFGNDPRFELHYYGRMQQDGRDMEQYAMEKKYSNVFFHGQYMPQERYDFAANIELIHNMYDSGPVTGNAIGNKYYDGIIFGIPQICTKGAYMGQLVEKQGVGISIGLDDMSIANKIWDYYHAIDFSMFEKKCNEAFEIVVKEQNEAKRRLLEFLLS